MAFVHGKNSVFKLGGTDITAYLAKEDLTRMCALADVTTQGKNSKAFIAGLKDATISISGKWDPAVQTVILAAIGVSTAWEFAPAGTGTGNAKHTGNCFASDYQA